jgi:predicted nucleic acid-binding protein
VIVAVDSSVLLDIFGADPRFGPASSDAMRRCLATGSVIACDAVWAEVACAFSSDRAASNAMAALGVRYSPIDEAAALRAGAAFRAYRARGGKRTRVVADFLVGGHAREQADQLLTRDRGFYRTCFRGLHIVDPTPRAP